MKATLVPGMGKEELEEFIQRYRNCKEVRDKIVVVLKKKLEASEDKQVKTSNYEMASWALFQADSIGYKRALVEAIELLDQGD